MQPSLQTFSFLSENGASNPRKQPSRWPGQTELLLIFFFCCAKNYSTKLNITSYLFQLCNCNVLCNKDLHFGAHTSRYSTVQLIFLSHKTVAGRGKSSWIYQSRFIRHFGIHPKYRIAVRENSLVDFHLLNYTTSLRADLLK